jgi:microsomal dipeptidase-like Zn-dependent dipeptidase
MPTWFKDNRDFDAIDAGLRATGLQDAEVAAIMGGNWYRFYKDNFWPA